MTEPQLRQQQRNQVWLMSSKGTRGSSLHPVFRVASPKRKDPPRRPRSQWVSDSFPDASSLNSSRPPFSAHPHCPCLLLVGSFLYAPARPFSSKRLQVQRKMISRHNFFPIINVHFFPAFRGLVAVTKSNPVFSWMGSAGC